MSVFVLGLVLDLDPVLVLGLVLVIGLVFDLDLSLVLDGGLVFAVHPVVLFCCCPFALSLFVLSLLPPSLLPPSLALSVGQMRAHQLAGQRQSNEFLLKRVEELEKHIATTTGEPGAPAVGTD